MLRRWESITSENEGQPGSTSAGHVDVTSRVQGPVAAVRPIGARLDILHVGCVGRSFEHDSCRRCVGDCKCVRGTAFGCKGRSCDCRLLESSWIVHVHSDSVMTKWSAQSSRIHGVPHRMWRSSPHLTALAARHYNSPLLRFAPSCRTSKHTFLHQEAHCSMRMRKRKHDSSRVCCILLGSACQDPRTIA
ncbi:hypothetical protein PENSPDRAFT_183369 [Peniophora sp. CONT]|nr:hypothetical protein PENSPDRAFT_183369 [Peniophora sp. CONT]